MMTARFQSASSNQPASPATFGANLYSHNGTAYPLYPAQWDAFQETGLAISGEVSEYSANPSVSNSTAGVLLADGELGIIINSNDLSANSGGAVPFGPMAFTPAWFPNVPLALFGDSSVQSINVSVDLQVPYFEMAGVGSTISSSQIVIYLSLIEAETGRRIAFGMTVFDSRGYSSQYSGIDNGPGGTGAIVYNQPAGSTTNLNTAVNGGVGFQGVPWNGYKTFDLQLTLANLAEFIQDENIGSSAPFSTNVADYELDQVSIDSEVEYFGQPNAIGYSMRNFDITTGALVNQLPVFSQADSTTGVSTTPLDTSYTGPVSYLDHQYIYGGSDDVIITASAPNVFIYGGSGNDAIQVSSGRNVLGGGTGSDFLVGGTGQDTFFLDVRGGSVLWDTIVNFHSGDAITIWGFIGSTFH